MKYLGDIIGGLVFGAVLVLMLFYAMDHSSIAAYR